MTNLIAFQNFEQAARFKYFLETANLVRIATVWLGLNHVQQQVYVRRVLKQCANMHETPLQPTIKILQSVACCSFPSRPH